MHLRTWDSAYVLIGRSRRGALRRAVRRGLAKSAGADRNRCDAAGARGVQLRDVLTSATAMANAPGGSGAAGLSWLARDGAGDGGGCGAVHRADRAWTAADGRAQCEP